MKLTRQVKRLLTMSPQEAWFRAGTLARRTTDRGLVRIRPGWTRGSLDGRLATSPRLAAAHRAVRRGAWTDAHQELRRNFLAEPSHFPLDVKQRRATADAITAALPTASPDSRAAADSICSDQRRLLGYRSLSYGTPPDWHADPVRGRRSPLRFWADVPFLDPVIGDHKVIWEINRHQHWMALGRAWWLNDDARYLAAFTTELASWMRANPPLVGINWASMLELAMRCLSWTWAAHFFAESDEPGATWMVDLLLGLDRQLTQVDRNLSHYFSPNTHLIGEALALFVCGHALPQLADSPARVETGRAALLASLSSQVLPDGGHCERSTHYHRYTLDFTILALIVARRAGDPAAGALASAVEQLAAAARLLADDSGRLPHIGDDDGGMLLPMCGRAPDDIADSLFVAAALTGRADLGVELDAPEEAFWLLGPDLSRTVALPPPRPESHRAPASRSLPSMGYFVSRSPQGTHVVIDAGVHGYLNGGHAHADALSMTLTIGRRPFLVDTGTASYTADPSLRDRFRHTAAHNTVLVDGRSQSEPAGPFHWRRVAHVTPARWHTSARFDYFEGAHDGYTPVEHRRHVLVLHDDLVIIADSIEGAGSHRADVHWHIAPEWTMLNETPHLMSARADDARVQLAFPAGNRETFSADPSSGLGWFSPAYGRVEPLTTVRVSAVGAAPIWLVTVVGLNAANRLTSVHELPFSGNGGKRSGTGLRLVRETSVDDLVIARQTPGGLWRWCEYESDARVLYCRRSPGGVVEQLVAIDSERVRISGAARERIALTDPTGVA